MFNFDESQLISLMPPDNIVGHPGGDRNNFLSIGMLNADFFYERKLFTPTSTVLDIGCSVGRVAIPLTQILTKGWYEGFDTVKQSIDWCTGFLHPKFPHFNFTHLDVYNSYYNSTGVLQGGTLRFPYGDQMFDFAWANSVFTHTGDAGCFINYVHEISRVLKSGGRFSSTFFLLDHLKPVSALQFPHPMGTELAVANQYSPDIVASFLLGLVERTFQDNDLMIDEVIRGNWSSGVYVEPFQDYIIATKK
jgi:SAM-dependent methyltransferase